MSKLERQQKKLEAMQMKEEQKLEKLREKELKKYEKSQKRSGRGPRINTPDINFRAEREIERPSEYEFSPKDTKSKKILAIVLWIIIAFFAFRGVVSVLNYENSKDIKNKMETYYDTMMGNSDLRDSAGSFAVNFINDYYTFDSNDNNWSTRVQKYLANGVFLNDPTELDSMSCKSVEIREIVVDGKYADVTASVLVEFLSTGYTTDDEHMTTKEGKIKYLVKIPIKTDGDNYAVLSAPVYVADYNKSQRIDADGFETDISVSKPVENALVKTAENFFAAYYGSKPSALKNYVTQKFDSSSVVGGALKFKSISDFAIKKASGGYRTKFNIVLNNGLCDVNETVYLKMVKGEQGLYYIDEMTIR